MGVFLAAIRLYPAPRFLRSALTGCRSGAAPFRLFPHLDRTAAFSIRCGNLLYNPFRIVSIAFL